MSDKLAELHEENARLRSDNAQFRRERDRREDLIGVMAERLARQGRQIAELTQEVAKLKYDIHVGISLD